MSTYTPVPGSLAARAILYFQRLPDEQLSVDDIVIKFSAAKALVHTELKTAVQAQALSRDGQIYGAGLQIDSLQIASPILTTMATVVNGTSAAKPFDPATVAIEDNMPIPRVIRGIDWDILLNRLKKGQSATIPKKRGATLRKAITARHNAKNGEFIVRNVNDEQIRVWRTA